MRAAIQVNRSSSSSQAREAIQEFDRFLEQGLTPSFSASLAALKACISLKDLQAGVRIHGEIAKAGVGSDVFVANTVVDMYSKCGGSMADARRVFEGIFQHSVVSWNTIIKGYVQRGQGEAALELFFQMQDRGFKPDAATYASALKACTGLAADGKFSKADCLSKGGILHSDIVSCGIEGNLFVASSLVDMYSKCGNVLKAKEVFDRVLNHDVVLWNSLIAGYVQSGDADSALRFFALMQEKGFVPNARSFTAALAACSSLAVREEGRRIGGKIVKVLSLEKGISVHCQLMNSKQELDVFLASALLDMYVKCGSMLEARRVFEEMPRHDVVSWTALILGHAQGGEGELALELFSRMRDDGLCLPNPLTYVAALEAVISVATREEQQGVLQDCRRWCLEKGMLLHSELAALKYEDHSLVASTLVDMYAKCGSVLEARAVFDRAMHHDLLLWNAIIRGYSQCGEAEVALQLYGRMRAEGFEPVALTFVSALKACGTLADLQSGKRIHSHIRIAGLEEDEVLANSLIGCYGKCCSLPDAQQVFISLKTKGLVTWNALMAAFSHHGDAIQVFSLFQKMQEEERLQPSGITFLCILTACSHAGLVDKGKEYFNAMNTDYGVTATIEHYSCMVDLLGRGNHLEEALATVKKMPMKPNVTIWRAILAGSRKWRNVKIGRIAFESIVAIDDRDAAAYSVMANIYAAAEMWEENMKIQAMRHSCRAWKHPGQSWWIDDDGLVHRFYVGDRRHPQSFQIVEKLKQVVVKMKEAGYEPDLESSLLFDISDEAKESALCGHSEKLAIGCALVNYAATPGRSIHIAKNLRACEDCHRATAIISKVEKRMVVCRDASRFHVFKDGVCSCGDFW